MTPLFSIVIPTWNRAGLIGRTLRAVQAQSFRDFEVVVVDDGSTDGTVEQVRRLAPEARIFTQDHRGCAAARNLGARQAAGAYLAFLDSDDFWLPGALATFARAIELGGGPAFVGGRLQKFDEEPPEAEWPDQSAFSAAAYRDFHRGASQARWGYGVAHGVIKRRVYLDIGGCLERNINCTDSDVLLKAGCAAGCVILRRPVTLMYRRHGGSTSVNFDKGVAGFGLFLEQERAGCYPGGGERAAERWAQITQRTRSFSVVLLQNGRLRDAMGFYRRTLAWNLRQRRWAYLTGLPLGAVVPAVRRRLHPAL